MAGWKYRKPEPSNVRGFCVRCEKRPQRKTSRGTFASICKKCDNELNRTPASLEAERVRKNKSVNLYKRPYRRHVKESCERCGFVPEHPCQLDVDHIDENHKNNDPSNLQTLCANCHRLKTFETRWEKS